MEAGRICASGLLLQKLWANLATIGCNNNRSERKPCLIPAQDLNPLTQTIHLIKEITASIHIKTSLHTKNTGHTFAANFLLVA